MRRVVNFLLGLVLVISGVLKLVDPVGTNFIIESYLEFLHLESLAPVSKVIAIALPLFEAILGAALISRIFRKVVKWITLAALAFFLIISVILVIANPLMDCGCFGEAIHLTHTQTLIKNIILIALFFADFYTPDPHIRPKYVGFSLLTLVILWFTIYGNIFIPIWDFTEYSTTLENLSVADEYGYFSNEPVVQGSVLITSVYDTDKFEDWSRVADAANVAEYCGFQPLFFLAATPEDAGILFDAHPELENLTGIVYYSDPRTLATLNRSNGGFTLACDGEVINKWSKRSLPDAEKLEGIIEDGMSDYKMKNSTRKRMDFQIAFWLGIVAAVLL